MGRWIALDVGTKRTGIAETDPLKIIASGLTTVNTPELLFFLEDYHKREGIEVVVVGEPKRLHGEASDVEAFIAQVVEKLPLVLPGVTVERMDERFTSKMAFQSIIDSGAKKSKRANKALIDEVSATIILQSYMDKKR